jgi:tetratricopeptide (TPR) repeat protein
VSAPSPDNTNLELQRARALCELRRFADASSLLEHVIAADPQIPAAWCLLAQAKLGTREPGAALQAARTAISVDPEMEWPHRLASVALSLQGQTKEAVHAAREAVRLDPQNWRGLVRLAEALTHVRSGLHEADTAAKRALELAPHEPAAHVVTGIVAARAENRPEAAEAFRRALAIDPENAAAHSELARLNVRRGRPRGIADAARGYATVLRSNPSDDTRGNLDVVMRSFLEWFSYLLFLDAFVLSGNTVRSGHLIVRLAPIALLAVPAMYALRFTARLPADLRRYLVRLPFVVPKIRLTAALEMLAIVAVIGGALAPPPARLAVVIGGGLAAAAARLALFVERKRVQAADPRAPIFSIRGLSILAGSLALGAAFSASDALTTKSRLVGSVWAIAFAAASALVVHKIRRRRLAQE